MVKRPPPLRSPFIEALTFGILFVLIFLIVRFDIRRYGPIGRDPLSFQTSALVALIGASIGTLYIKIKPR